MFNFLCFLKLLIFIGNLKKCFHALHTCISMVIFNITHWYYFLTIRITISLLSLSLIHVSEQGSVSNEEPSSSRINHLKIPPILNDDDDDASDEYEAEKPIEMEHATVASNEFIWTEKFFFEENDRRLDGKKLHMCNKIYDR